MQQDGIRHFLAASTEERLRLALDEVHAKEVQAYLGRAAFEEYVEIARRVTNRLDEQHLGLRAPTNLIFVPGVMGSLLQSRHYGGVWWIDVRTRNHIDHLRLAPDGRRAANPAHEVAPFSTDPSYEPFLAAVMERDDFGHTLFPYDWRKPLSLSTAALRDKIREVYEGNGHEPVHLVAHSMGGLMVRATLMEHGREVWPKLGRMVFIGTPHYGSPAVAAYLKNHLWGVDLLTLLGWRYLSRETFRSLQGVLSMLPAPRGLYPGTRTDGSMLWDAGNTGDAYVHPCANFDLYNVETWRLDLPADDASQLQQVLDRVAVFHGEMYEAHQGLDQEQRDRMAVIAGVGYKTLFRLAYRPGLLGLWEHMDKETARVARDPHREGDGRVPLASAFLEHVGDIRYVKGEHKELARSARVYEDTFRWLKGEKMRLPDTLVEALSQHLGGDMAVGEAPHLAGTARSDAAAGDPGYWDLQPPDPTRLVEMEAQLDGGQLHEFITVRLL